MIQPWFNPNHYAWIPGTALGSVAVVLAGFVFWLVPQGRAKAFIVRAWIGLWVVALTLLGIGVFALLSSQPWGIWYSFLLPGVVGAFVLGGNFLIILKRYRRAEQLSISRRPVRQH